jgi:hypothetical protein
VFGDKIHPKTKNKVIHNIHNTYYQYIYLFYKIMKIICGFFLKPFLDPTLYVLQKKWGRNFLLIKTIIKKRIKENFSVW